MDSIFYYYNLFMEISQKNMVMGGALGAGLGVWLFTALRRLPLRLWHAVKSQLVVQVMITNTGNGYNERNFDLFSQWVSKQPLAGMSRRMSINSVEHYQSDNNGKPAIGLGLGLHFFIFRNRLCWFTKDRMASQGSHVDKQEVNISMLSRNRQLAFELLEEFRWKPQKSGLTVTYWDGNRWANEIEITKRDLSTVIIRKEIKDKLIAQIDKFYSDRSWYDNKGLPYKFTALLHGPGGTGKSSISKAIASHYDRNVSMMSLSEMSNEGLRRAFATLPKGNILLIEDFDDCAAVKDRVLADPVKAQTAITQLCTKYNIKPLDQNFVKRQLDLDVSTVDDHYFMDCHGELLSWQISTNELTCWGGALARDLGLVGSQFGEDSHKDFFARYHQLMLATKVNNGNAPSGGLTLSALLNALDGIVPLDETMVIMNTNHPENLDAALVRKGRVDLSLEIPYLRDTEIREYFNLMFPDFVVPTTIVFKDAPGCDVMAAFNQNRDDPMAMVKELKHDMVTPDQSIPREILYPTTVLESYDLCQTN